MASTITKVPILRVAAARGYATQAVPVAGSPSYDVKTTVLSNKLVIASADNDSAVSRVSIIFRAGSRNETRDNQGAAHMLRIATGLTTKTYSQFAIIRQIQQVGASLRCATDRELIAYTIEGTRSAVDQTLPILAAVATQQELRPWEISDNVPRARAELSIRPPQLRAIDLLHKAAYRTGLGNSLYIAKYNLGDLSSETLQHYVKTNFTGNRAAVIGLGVSHENLVKCAQTLELGTGSENFGSGVYKGGEIRSDKRGDFAYVAIAAQGASLADPKEANAFAVLQNALGASVSVKRGLESGSLLRKIVGDSAEPCAISALNVNYSDSGLFGVVLAGSSKLAGKLTTTVIKTLRTLNASDEEINRGKKKLLADILYSWESGSNALESIGRQVVLTGNVKTVAQLIADVEAVSVADVREAAQKIAKSKISLAGVGNLSSVPFYDEI